MSIFNRENCSFICPMRSFVVTENGICRARATNLEEVVQGMI